MSSLYLHIPFCRSKCLYCSFNSYAGQEAIHDRYIKALCREIAETLQGQTTPLDTIFIGGGTPTVLAAEKLALILSCCKKFCGIADKAEITVEANPGTLSFGGMSLLREAGFNRLSFGIQSWQADELHILGRSHLVHESELAVKDARRAGFDNLSFDLMYGLPNQNPASWRENLDYSLSLKPDHLSAYQLTVEEGTVFETSLRSGTLRLPNEDDILEMDSITDTQIQKSDLIQYEISNYAIPGRECRHNLVYWHNEEYLACGAGAVSYEGGVRSRRVEDPLGYCRKIEKGERVIVDREYLERDEAFRETVVMGLRLNKGVFFSRLNDRFSMTPDEVYRNDVISDLVNEGFLEADYESMRLTAKGRCFANLVMSRLV